MKEEQLSCNNEEEYHKLGTDGWEDSESQIPQSHNSYPQSAFLSTTHHLKGKKNNLFQFSSVQFSHSVVSHSLRPHELQHARPTCPSPTPRVQSNSHPSIRWCHPAISSSVVPFSSCPQSLPASESFPMSQLFAWSSFAFSKCHMNRIMSYVAFSRLDSFI